VRRSLPGLGWEQAQAGGAPCHARYVAFGPPKPEFRHALKFIGGQIPQAPEAFLTLSFRLDLTIYRRYNPRT
jgi:hypothetical protein